MLNVQELCFLSLRWVWISSGTHQRLRAILGDDRDLFAHWFDSWFVSELKPHWTYDFDVTFIDEERPWFNVATVSQLASYYWPALHWFLELIGQCLIGTNSGYIQCVFLLCLLASCGPRAHCHKVEQPSSSVLIYWPYMQFLMTWYEAVFRRLFLGGSMGEQ